MLKRSGITSGAMGREGLLIIGLAVLGWSIAFAADSTFQHSNMYKTLMTPALYSYEPLSLDLAFQRALSLFRTYHFPVFPHYIATPHRILWSLWIEHLGEFIFLYGYLFLLPIRFMVWFFRRPYAASQ